MQVSVYAHTHTHSYTHTCPLKHTRTHMHAQETTLYGCTVRINEPVGVIGIACPDDYPLLAFVSLFSPAVVRGNTIVIIPSEKYPLSATDLYQVRINVLFLQHHKWELEYD